MTAQQQPRVWCTASGQRRSWLRDEWINSEGKCPDCGRTVKIRNVTTRFPAGVTVRHYAPEGVTPAPYAADEKRGA
jgi:hypothetical protein